MPDTHPPTRTPPATPAPVRGRGADDPARAHRIGDQLVAIHTELRTQLARVRAGLADTLDTTPTGPRPSLDAQLHAHCVTFCGFLHVHHTREEEMMPGLLARMPGAAAVIDRIHREHAVVARLLTAIETTLADVDADPRQVRADVERLADELEEHLRYEEEQLVDYLNTV